MKNIYFWRRTFKLAYCNVFIDNFFLYCCGFELSDSYWGLGCGDVEFFSLNDSEYEFIYSSNKNREYNYTEEELKFLEENF